MWKEYSMAERRGLQKATARQYRTANKKEKGALLKDFVEKTKYNRCYAGWMLRNYGRNVVGWQGKQRVVYVGDGKRRRRRKRIYGDKEVRALKKIWYCLDCPCGKRLAPYLKVIIPQLQAQGELRLDGQTRSKLEQISARTIERLVSGEKRKWEIRGKSRTKPGTLLKSQIPIRTFAEWDEKMPGFVEMDTVSHDGGQEQGIFAQSIDATDVCTGWTETMAVANRSNVRVLEGIQRLRRQFPFPWKGLDTDGGGEFINHDLVTYCEHEQLEFTRSRPYRKNDSCYVEQKNWMVVRKVVGYYRYETAQELALLNRIYGLLRLYTNFFQPQMRLLNKERIGSKIRRAYDEAKTPYQRVMEHPGVTVEIKKQLKTQARALNPVSLKRSLLSLQGNLFRLALRKPWYQNKRRSSEQFR